MTTYLNLDMHSKKITNLGTPSSGDDVIDITYANSYYLQKSGGSSVYMSGDLYVGSSSSNRHLVRNVANPILAYDAANKNYVDNTTFTSFSNWVADDFLDMDHEDIINVWDLEIDGNNLWLDGTDIENTGDIDSDWDSNYDIGTNTNRYANIYGDDIWGTTHDLEWAERICPICKKRFKEGEFLIQVVSGVGESVLGRKKDITRTVPIHLNCVNELKSKEESKQEIEIKNMMKQITKLKEELLEIKRQKDEKNRKIKEKKRESKNKLKQK